MVNQFLKARARELHDLNFKLESVIEFIYDGLENDCVSEQTAMDFNAIICDIREDGMRLLTQICRFYQNQWKNK